MQETLSPQRKAGGFLGAKRFVPVSNMRMMGGIDVMSWAVPANPFSKRLAGELCTGDIVRVDPGRKTLIPLHCGNPE
ncbi:MAG: hypothetical protein KIT13_03155 [Burkholderiales bacterium]|nr:hypothetical protein [Burkholderiales bacterium]